MFAGSNMVDGDLAKWVHGTATSCESKFDATGVVPMIRSGAIFNFASILRASTPTSTLQLCYKFMYGGFARASPFILFPNIRVSIITFDSVTPSATGVGCATSLTVKGAGFAAHGARTFIKSYCGFVGLVVRVNATILNDTHMTCVAPAASTVGTFPMRVDFGWFGMFSVTHPVVFPAFHAFDPSLSSVTFASPAGGAYNLKASISIRGSAFRDYGAPRCRFGTYVGGWATVNSATQAICEKPRFPDSDRSLVGEVPVSFSPNGQCFPTAPSMTNFSIYNSQVTTVAVRAGPARTPHEASTSLEVRGEGFAFGNPLLGGTCLFVPQGTTSPGAGYSSPMQVVSTTSVICERTPPVTEDWGAMQTFNVFVYQGRSRAPSLYGPPEFSTYDISTVRVSSVDPPGGPTGEVTVVTVRGSGFADYGDGQIKCRLGVAGGTPALVTGFMLSPTQVSCTLPAAIAAGNVDLELSLNNATAGSFSNDKWTFAWYAPPLVFAVIPNKGDASGGTVVTLGGRGIAALSTDAAFRAANLRCRFGTTVQSVPPSSHTDHSVVCTSTWGAGSQPVSLSLNGGGSFRIQPDAEARITYVGLHPPAMVEVYFPPDATTLVIRFDSQATNRAGMSGMSSCRRVLDDVTSDLLKGNSTSDALCGWLDDTTLFAQLNMLTAATGGMPVTLRSNVLWPKSWGYPGSCSGASSMCANSQSLTVDEFFPCDRLETVEVEACVVPVAVVQGPIQLSSCPGSSMLLDGSRSFGGGIKALTYSWRANPLTCDK